MWVHHSVGILHNNRTAHQEVTEVPEGFEGEVEDYMKIIESKDPFDARLKPISEDNKVTVSKSLKTSPWVVKLMGDTT